MFNWFSKKSEKKHPALLKADMHSHLLPGIDDGVRSLDESLAVIQMLKRAGYQKLITTPHVMADTYQNTPEIILDKLASLRHHLQSHGETIEIEAAAEYYLDEHLTQLLEKNSPLLTFGNNYLLFETNFLTEPFNLNEFIFNATTKGYRLILAHPERYLYLQNKPDRLEDLIFRGVLFQVNMISLTGYYSKQAQKTAKLLVDKGWVHFLGTDCHHEQHASIIADAASSRDVEKALNLPLMNNSLI